MKLPPHAYVPGQTPRHDPARFDDLHSSVRPGMTPAELTETSAWRAGWLYLQNGFYWEAHEAFEPVWMQTLPNSVERHLVQALIQIANASLKDRMQRPRAVARLCDLAQTHLQACERGAPTVMTVKLGLVEKMIQNLREKTNPG